MRFISVLDPNAKLLDMIELQQIRACDSPRDFLINLKPIFLKEKSIFFFLELQNAMIYI